MYKKSKRTIFTISASFLTMLMLAACGSESTIKDGDTSVDSNHDSGVEEVQEHELIFSHLFPPQHAIHANVVEPFVEELEEASDGRITTEIYATGALGNPESQYDMAVTRTAEISLSVHGYTPGRFPLVSVVELPFIASSAEEGASILWTLYDEFSDLQEEHGDTTPLWLFAAEPAQILSANKPIESVGDLNGLRVRSPSSLANEILEAFGATPVSMPMGEVYEALERGAVDAAMAPLSTIDDYSFKDVVSYITVGNFSLTPFFTVMNTDAYNEFSSADQELISSIGSDYATKAGAAFDASGESALNTINEEGITLIELNDLTPWEKAVENLVEKWINDMEAKGFAGQEIYERAVELGGK
ncbi:TRAP transporter substrate-binding protein [Bacillus sp. FJAT-45350]|uniref:TRAP transporter substrate-binding protein n=1 Tax=Bacillus sp. FJAT-45350 TaxID=2011014 RepID=UPI000BB6F453|nr:TRAP transporter substrate-binding protein [Bacillus sp. FJAT-45350]